MEEFLEHDEEGNIYKSGSVKKENESLIRRLLSSKYHQSRRKARLRKENSSNYSFGAQGSTNAGFESNNDKNIPSNIRTSLSGSNTSLNNAVSPNPSNSNVPKEFFRPNSLNLQRVKPNHLQEAENKTHRRKVLHLAPQTPTEDKAIPVSKTVSAPHVKFVERSQTSSPDVEDENLEADFKESEIDRLLMSAIPEEISRAASLTNVEPDASEVNQNSLKQLQDVQHLIHEASEALKGLNNSVKAHNPSNSNVPKESLRPNRLNLQSVKPYHMQEAENKTHRRHVLHSAPQTPTEDKAIPVSKAVSARHVNFVDRSQLSSPDVEDENLEADFKESEIDTLLMPAIPEEISRAASLTNVEPDASEVNQNSLKQFQDVQHLIHEAIEALKGLNNSVKVQKYDQSQESNDNVPCCSVNNENEALSKKSISDVIDNESEDKRQEDMPDERPIVIDIDEGKESKPSGISDHRQI
ncbi:unnamed protein product [Larinioides sclopetarius]|uniref:Uncharacterized protein n=1 Tax=Larinioides sclopetarius TaxID=280406 RepID=A0AAV2BDP7_9ARAC